MDDGTFACDAPGCERELAPSDVAIVFETIAGEKRAAECDCGAVTIAVTHREDRSMEFGARE